ncbi:MULTISPECIES: hypothetical protein [Bradyrhizobium]|uniref:Uncharacterized protein n=1 Tax=Bradyrhizobium elkanii TaxID=29448 RepID=A0A8I1Y3B4_BRAEL|nr:MULTISPECIES: hypothetical protein [Bradyrhizobium]MBP1293764.1 hypothetical protein [Bradyrhizobium elkanii]MCP1925652.1 hypothetical protein [Bradyrhizobium elkanii]MCS3451289.1 hypothetical protein [Bradyrhizobium elkanii]MCS3476856.1 hypothetical protein [Bradyrhizobium elkanii]MCS3566686.1 hypothetical protein [Bradyrhizobium elkanii]
MISLGPFRLIRIKAEWRILLLLVGSKGSLLAIELPPLEYGLARAMGNLVHFPAPRRANCEQEQVASGADIRHSVRQLLLAA